MSSGVGCEFGLVRDGQPLCVDAAIDWFRLTVPDLDPTSGQDEGTKRHDSHANLIIDATRAGFVNENRSASYDQNLFGMLSVFVHGGGFSWFEEIYTCHGFMLVDAHTCRVYIQINAEAGVTIGLDLPLARADGTINPGMGGSFPQELASVVGSGALHAQPEVPSNDEYCTKVYDMARWIDASASPV